MTQNNYEPGMKQLADVVAGLYKDVKLMKECSWLGGAQKFAAKHPGWTATAEDLTGPQGVPDGVDEILIRDKKGNIRVVNGYTLKPSQHALRQAYYTDVLRNDDKTLRDLGYEPDTMRYKMMLGRPKKGETMKKYKKFINEYQPIFINGKATGKWELEPRDKLAPAAEGLRKMSKPTPIKLFREWLQTIWNQYTTERAQRLTVAGTPDNISPDLKLKIHNLWSNLEYLNRVVVPVLTQMGIDYNSLPYREDVAKYTNKAEFKEKALILLQQLAQNIDHWDDEMSAELQEFFNRGTDYAERFEYRQKPPKPEELKHHRN